MLSAAIDWRWIEGPNPVGQSSGRAEVRELLRTAGEIGPDYLAFFRLAAITGARRGELCALTWRDIDFSEKALTISKATQSIRMTADGRTVKDERVASTKTGDQRIVPLDSVTLDSLVELREAAAEAWRAIKHSTSDASFARAFVFAADPDGQIALSKGAWSARWRRVQDRSGITGIRLHDLRHFVGVSLAKSGRPLREIMDQLGHRRLSTTEIYLTAPSSTAPADVMAGILVEPEVVAAVPAPQRNQRLESPWRRREPPRWRGGESRLSLQRVVT